MTTIEERLDQYIDALNEGRPTNGNVDDAELEGLFSTVRQLQTLRDPDWPDADFPETLAAGLANELTPHQNGHHSGSMALPVSNPWTHRPDTHAEEPEPAPPSRLRQIAQFTGAIAALSIFGLVLIVVFRDAGGDGFLAGAGPDEPAVAQIAFTAMEELPDPDSTSPAKIHLVNADGTNLITLADGAFPSWSPDGSHIAYSGFGDSTGAIHVMDADGSNQQRLTDSDVDEITPAWSPDGRNIAFLRSSANEGSSALSLWVIRPDGSNERMLVEESAGIYFPIGWSPDGSQIAFNRMSEDGAHRIEIVDVTSGEIRTVTDSTLGTHVWLTWSPDGDRIASVSETPDSRGFTRIHLIDVNSGAVTFLPETPSAQTLPMWSPDGQWLAFLGEFDGTDAIYTVATDDLQEAPQLIYAEENTSLAMPSWSPDSSQIAFIRNSRIPLGSDTFQNTFEVAVVDLDGSNLTVVTDDIPLAALSPPAWRPTSSATPVDATPTVPQPAPTVVPIEPSEAVDPTLFATPTISPSTTTITTNVSADEAIEIARQAVPVEPFPQSDFTVNRAELTEHISGPGTDIQSMLIWSVEIVGAPAAIMVDATTGEIIPAGQNPFDVNPSPTPGVSGTVENESGSPDRTEAP